ncbi:MAG: 23S rRNA (adenine(2503)-C(2))-methyltransferase RlmN [Pseudomonadota bacterium]
MPAAESRTSNAAAESAASSVVTPAKKNLLDFDLPMLEQELASLGEKPFRARQILKWVYHQHVHDFSEMSNISLKLRRELSSRYTIALPQIMTQQTSQDGTRKWLLALSGGNAVEVVYIPEPNRGTLCISSQVGCMLNCTFCSTATQGFSRNLSTGEIVGQVLTAARELGHCNADRKITNVVFMGMGEPLLNPDNVFPAIRLLLEDLALGFAARRVTVSTAGLVPGIDQLKEVADVSLAVSLHGAENALRTELVPLNKKYPIAELLAACRRYLAGKARARITFEYTLIEGVNDHPEHARSLIRLLRQVPSKLNLIPFNPFPGTDYQRSSPQRIATFQKIIQEAGVVATLRRTRGDDIDAACGQLVGRVKDRTRRQERHQTRLLAKGAATPDGGPRRQALEVST